MSQRVLTISMTVSVMQWRMEIGNFSNFSVKHLKIKINKADTPIHFCIQYFISYIISFLLQCFYFTMRMIVKILVFFRFIMYLFFIVIPKVTFSNMTIIIRYYFSYIFSIFLVYLLYNIRLIRLSGDIEVNPGPKTSSFKEFSVCHWNLNSISSHDFLKVKLLTAYNAVHNFDIICISKSYLNSEILSSDENLNIPGYNMFRADHPSGNRRGGVCIYYRESLPIKLLNVNYLKECICFDLKIGKKLCTIVALYRSPSQSLDEFENFLNNLNLTLESITQKNPFLTIVIGDFNARLSKWWTDDKTTQEGLKLEHLLSQFALSQVINQPTHISHKSNSCIDLMFTNQRNLITDSGTHPSLHPNCHHQIIYGKFNLKVLYPPPYERHVWHYEHANVDMISKAIEGFDWRKAFSEKSVDEKASILTQTLLNILSNFIPNEIVTINDRDPPWINNKIRSLIKNKTIFFKKCFNPNNIASIKNFEQMQDSLRKNIEISKQKYYAKQATKLTSNKINPKCYWSILKSFLNNKKIPCIPPLIHNNQFITDFKEKSELLNSFKLIQLILRQTMFSYRNWKHYTFQHFTQNRQIFK